MLRIGRRGSKMEAQAKEITLLAKPSDGGRWLLLSRDREIPEIPEQVIRLTSLRGTVALYESKEALLDHVKQFQNEN